jgi:hypothetical protein
MINEKWGFLRETAELAKKAGIDYATGLHRTGLDEYLKVIFPEITDWVHDKSCKDWKRKLRPDYRSEELNLIIEFDGLPHYNNIETIINDKESTLYYTSLGYRVVRIPYFIQLTNKAVKTLFNRNIPELLFNESIPSLSLAGKCSPANLCPAGIKRMVEEFSKFPEQLKVNMDYLKSLNDPIRSGVEYLEEGVYGMLDAFADDMKNLDPDISQLVSDNFWDLV